VNLGGENNMISEEELERLSFAGAPKIITDGLPGPKSKKILDNVPNYESLVRPGGKFPIVWDEGFGATVKDPDGNLFIDMSAGVGVSNVGRRHPKVLEAMEKQMGKLLHATEGANTPRAELAIKLSQIMPDGLKGNCVTYFTQSGSGAIETAIKLSRKYTGKNQIVGFHGCYHGVWSGAASLSCNYRTHLGFGPLVPGMIHLPYAYCYRCPYKLKYPSCGILCGQYADYVLNTPSTYADDVAAVILEPHQGEGGYISPPPEFLEIVAKAAKKCGALFVVDEIQAGAGRTGKMWSIQHSKAVPDILVWGKGLGGDAPMAGLTFSSEIEHKLRELQASQAGTFAGNALSCVICSTNIDILTDKQSELTDRATQLGETLKKRILNAAKDIKIIGDVRVKGLMIGIELVKDKESKEPVSGDILFGSFIPELFNKGIIGLPCGRYASTMRLMPSLIITKKYAEKGIDLVLDMIKSYENKFIKG
jgi:4-aminobutyrate aminotransferase